MKHLVPDSTPVSMSVLALVAMVGCAGSVGAGSPSNKADASTGPTGGAGGGGAEPIGPIADGPAPDYPPLPDGPPTMTAYDLRPTPDNPPAVVMVNSQACQSLQKGPFNPVMGQAIFSEKAPPIKPDGQAYRVTLPPHGQAHVTFTAPAGGDYVLFTSINLPVNVFDLAGMIWPEKSLVTLVQECMEAKTRYVFALTASSFVLRVGADPKNAPSVDVVLIPAQ
jgi:hypothetical protein